MTVKDGIKMLRKELHLSQVELAQELNCNFTTINRWENDKAEPNGSTAALILTYAKESHVSKECQNLLRESFMSKHARNLQVPSSNLFSVERDSICQLVDDSANAIYVCDSHTDELLYMNHQAEKYFGKRWDRNAKEKCYTYIWGSTKPCSFCPKKKLSPIGFSDFHTTSPITKRNYHVKARNIEWNGRDAHAQYFVDETYELSAQEGLKRVLDHVEVGISVGYIHNDGRIELSFLNEGYYQMIHSTLKNREKYQGYNALDAVYEVDKEKLVKVIKKQGEKGESFSTTFRVVMDDGNTKCILMHASFQRKNQEETMFYCSFTDVDSLMRTKEKIDE